MSVEIRGSLRLPWQCHQPSWVPPQECSHGKGALQRSWLELLSPRGKNLERSSSNFKGDATNTLILTALARTSKGIIYSSFIIILPIPVHPRRHSLASSQKFRSPQSKPLAACTGNPKILRDKETEQSPSDADIVVNLLGNFFQNKNWCPIFSFVSVASMVNGAHFLNGASCRVPQPPHDHRMLVENHPEPTNFGASNFSWHSNPSSKYLSRMIGVSFRRTDKSKYLGVSFTAEKLLWPHLRDLSPSVALCNLSGWLLWTPWLVD